MIKPRSFLFTTWEGGGNVPPLLEAVRKLAARGHRVRFMSEEVQLARAGGRWRHIRCLEDRAGHSF